MQIYLLDINPSMTEAWRKYFVNNSDVIVVNNDFKSFMDLHPEIEAIVSPANSYGLMDGGYDKAITDYLGKEVQHAVQEEIINKWCGEQPVGTSLSVETNRTVLNTTKNMLLIHTPTMRKPEVIVDNRIIYQCMRTTLIEAIHKNIKSIVIPAFGGLCGQVPLDTIASHMFVAYEQLINYIPHKITWKDAIDTSKKLEYNCK